MKIVRTKTVCLVAIALTVLAVLCCIIWRPRTKQEWLGIFENSLAFSKDSTSQKTEKRIAKGSKQYLDLLERAEQAIAKTE